jgi:uncharacterized protein with PIN domain
MDETPRFLADSMLGKLARWLRVLGYDAGYERAMEDGELVERARAEGRILLTRDRRLLERRRLDRGFFVDDEDPMEQVRQVADAFDLSLVPERLFSRCLDCNEPMEEVAPEAVKDQVPPYVFATQKTFARCPACARIYWSATHVEGMRKRLARALTGPGSGPARGGRARRR